MSGTSGKPLLGIPTQYPDRYAPELLVSIPRSPSRRLLGIEGVLPFVGTDSWTAYELSWLDSGGKPRVAIAEIHVACDSTYIVESKSCKLYLNSLNQSVFDSEKRLQDTLVRDLGSGFGGPVEVMLYSLDEYRQKGLANCQGDCLDELPVICDRYQPDPGLLAVDRTREVAEAVYSHLLKTNCPVTGQPDWATIGIQYIGCPIERGSLLRYLVSFRQHQDFHEHSVERIFMDLLAACAPTSLVVHARYTRRGGLDINPCRSTADISTAGTGRTVRQ